MISDATRQYVLYHCKQKCMNPSCRIPLTESNTHFHHAIFKSEYHGEDRDEAWNIFPCCVDCHTSIHDKGNQVLRLYLRDLANQRKARHERTGGTHRDLKSARARQQASYRKFIEQYRATHNGKSPASVNYEWCKSQKEKQQKLKKAKAEMLQAQLGDII